MGLGVAVFTIAISALLALATITVAVAVFDGRFGTILLALAVAGSAMNVPEGVLALTCNTRVKLAVAFKAKLLPSVHVIVPVAPTAGNVPQVQPAGGAIDWKFVLGGVVCVKVTEVATAGPLFVTVCV